MTLAELKAVAGEIGMPSFAARQMAEWLYGKKVASIDEMTNISAKNRRLLNERYTVGCAAPVDGQRSADGTVKYLYRTAAGGYVETVYIPDEPTTGLHIADVHRLIEVLQKLVDAGNTVIVIEHNLDLIKCADHIIDLGPEGGSAGGLVIAEGTPEQVAEVPGSFTGQYLKPLLEKDRQLRAAEAETGAKAKK